jgi:iron only hydrogenase large subunit-like protein
MDDANNFYHTVTLDETKCKGCTHCVKRCPTEAIRVREGKAKIIKERCIDCGECIRTCPHHAKIAIMDSLDAIKNFKYTVVLPAPSLYGQPNNVDNISAILAALKKMGFDDIFEVAKAAEMISAMTREYIKKGGFSRPAISSACPAVVRLLRVRFPELLDILVPFFAPIELAAKLARENAMKKTSFKAEEIGTVFISPCPAKKTASVAPLGLNKSQVDLVIPIKDIFPLLKQNLKTTSNADIMNTEQLFTSGRMGIRWGSTGGEAYGLMNESYIAVDGIDNVIKTLEEIEDGRFTDLDFVELNSCPGGCVGGVFTVDNAYAAKAKMQRIGKYLPMFRNDVPPDIAENDFTKSAIQYLPVMSLSDNLSDAIHIMQEVEKMETHFNGVDCGSCGAPNCRAHAEDVVKGYAKESDCIYIKQNNYISLLRSLNISSDAIEAYLLRTPNNSDAPDKNA